MREITGHLNTGNHELAAYLGLSPRQCRDQCAKWAAEVFLTVANASKKGRSYRLPERFEGAMVVNNI